MENVKSHRNKLSGIRLHYGQGGNLKNVVIANVRAGLDIVYTNDITLENVEFNGYNAATQGVAAKSNWRICFNNRPAIYGISTPTNILCPYK
eukprot:1371683-Ditylum_brightwellii.AAC.1